MSAPLLCGADGVELFRHVLGPVAAVGVAADQALVEPPVAAAHVERLGDGLVVDEAPLVGLEAEHRQARLAAVLAEGPAALGADVAGLRAAHLRGLVHGRLPAEPVRDRKSTRLNSSHVKISYAV